MTRWLADLVLARPGVILLIGTVLAIAGAVAGVLGVRFDADTDSLIFADRPFMRDYESFKARFGDLERIWVVVDAGDNHGAGAPVVDWLEPRLQALHLPQVAARITAAEQAKLVSWAAPPNEVEAIAGACALLAKAKDGPDALLLAASGDLQATGAAFSDNVVDPQERIGAAVTAITVLVGEGGPCQDTVGEDRYLTSPSGRLSFIGILPEKDYSTLAVIEAPLVRIRAILSKARNLFPRVDIGLTGKPVIQADEMRVTQEDMRLAAIVAMVLVSGLVMLILREVKRPLLTIVAFALAVGWTWGFVALAIGRLTLLSIVFLLVMIGVGLDFGVHVVSRHAALRGTNSREKTIYTLLKTTIRSNMVAAVTSVAVFLAALTTNFRGLQELGIIASMGIVLSLVAMSTVLPALLVVFDRYISRPTRVPPPPRAPRYRRLVLWVAFAAGIGGWGIARNLQFETNLMALQAPGLQAGIWERRIAADAAGPTWFGAMQARDLDHAAELVRRAANEPEIGLVDGILSVVSAPDPVRRRARAQLASCGAGVDASEETRDSESGNARDLAVSRLRGLAMQAKAIMPDQVEVLSVLADRLAAMSQEELSTAAHRTAVFFDGVRAGAASSLRDVLPLAMRGASMAPDGTLLVMAHPRDDVWDESAMAAFVDALRRVDANVTGVPVTHLESIRDMKRGFLQMTGVAAIAVLVILLVESRRLREPLVCMAALVVAGGWMLGVATLVGLHLNLANFFAVPVLIGLGVDGAIHVAHRRRKIETDGATRRAVLLTSLTTMVGFGSLMLASHRGQASLGALMLIGCLACLLSSLFVVPAALRPRSASVLKSTTKH